MSPLRDVSVHIFFALGSFAFYTHFTPSPKLSDGKKADKIITRASNSFLDFTFHFLGIV
jgi:hypothetical protein